MTNEANESLGQNTAAPDSAQDSGAEFYTPGLSFHPGSMRWFLADNNNWIISVITDILLLTYLQFEFVP